MSGIVVWFTGLPASGKSTLAQQVRQRLQGQHVTACLLDSDTVRSLLAPTLGYSDDARAAFYRALANLAAELARQGLVVLVAATAHRREYRELARLVAPAFLEVWVTTNLDDCRARDPKGLYAASVGSRGSLPGADVHYETPERADVLAGGGSDSAAQDRIVSLIAERTADRE